MQDLRTVRRRAVATVAATALAATALAGPAAAAGPSFPLSFIGIYKNGSPVKAKKFQFAGAPVSCAEGTTTYGTSRPLPAMKIRKREFSGTFLRSGTKIRVTGKYKRNLKKVTGTLKVTGKVGSYTNCTSGKMVWKTN